MKILRNVTLAAALLVIAVGSSLPAWADCQSDEKAAMQLILGVKKQALSNQKIDTALFSSDLKVVMARLQSQNCVSELMSILQFVQTEQKLYPAPPGAPKVSM